MDYYDAMAERAEWLEIEEGEMIASYCELQAWHLREAGYAHLADEVEAVGDPCFADDLITEVLGA